MPVPTRPAAEIYPAEVESALLELPGVQEAAVIGVPDPEWPAAIPHFCTRQ